MVASADLVDGDTGHSNSRVPGSSSSNGQTSSEFKEWTPQAAADVAASQQLPLSNNHVKDSPIRFFHLLERLKTTKREGWLRFGINNGESISDHMYRMSIMTMFAPTSLSTRLDVLRCSRMALVHDMAESLVGDITPADGIKKEEKNRRESSTMDYICKDLLGEVHDGSQAAEMRALWQEYEDGKTLESKFVHDIDKLELILQMVEYERTHRCKIDLSEFAWVAQLITLPEIRTWCDQVLEERAFLWKNEKIQPSIATVKDGLIETSAHSS